VKNQVVAKSIVRNPDGDVLLLRRSSTDTNRPGEWDYPGGNVDPGEDIFQAGAREIFEEAGLAIDPAALKVLYAGTMAWEPSDTSVTRLLLFGETTEKNVVLSHEHDEYRWVSIETALRDFPHFFYAVGLQYAVDHKLLTS
jgi:8-oxo-dGTP pyrophosphatase MutT (NUDIX family)